MGYISSFFKGSVIGAGTGAVACIKSPAIVSPVGWACFVGGGALGGGFMGLVYESSTESQKEEMLQIMTQSNALSHQPHHNSGDYRSTRDCSYFKHPANIAHSNHPNNPRNW